MGERILHNNSFNEKRVTLPISEQCPRHISVSKDTQISRIFMLCTSEYFTRKIAKRIVSHQDSALSDLRQTGRLFQDEDSALHVDGVNFSLRQVLSTIN